MYKYKWAFIGCKSTAKRAARSITRSEHIITAVYSNDISKSDKFALKYGAAVFESVDGLLKFGDFDCIYISSPRSLSNSQLLTVLQSGKPVLCEAVGLTVTAGSGNIIPKYKNLHLIKTDYLAEFTNAAAEAKADI